MAFLSREFWKDDKERLAAPSQSVTAPDAVGAATPSAGASPDPGAGANAAGSFFAANKDAGKSMWQQMADRLSSQIGNVEAQKGSLPVETRGADTYGMRYPAVLQGVQTVTSHYSPNAENIQKRADLVGGIDSTGLRGMEGQPGMSRWDSWLAQGAADPRQAAGLKDRLDSLGKWAGEKPQEGEARDMSGRAQAYGGNPWLRGGHWAGFLGRR